jgi:hypothetical protein
VDSEFSGLLLLLARPAEKLFEQRLQPLSGYCGLAKVDLSIK